jgi:hypothetical protein
VRFKAMAGGITRVTAEKRSRTRKLGLTRGAILFGSLLALACEQLLSIDGAVVVATPDAGSEASADAAAEACGLGVAAGACQACVASRCCEQATACAQDPACATYESCLLGCGGDYACRAACVQSHQIGNAPDVPTFEQCVVSSCADPCGMSCGQSAPDTPPDAAATCMACIAAHACMAGQACTSDLTCELETHCVYACGTPDCQSACSAKYDAGAYITFALGIGGACYSQCEVGNFWACVGRTTWPFAPQTGVDATLTVVDFTTGAPIQNVAVAACDHLDDPCTAPVAPATTTNPQGRAEMSFMTTGLYGFQGYFDLTSPALSLGHYQYFLSFPLSEAKAQVLLAALSPATFQNLVSIAHVQLDPMRGHIVMQAEDCLLIPSSGVTVTAQGTDSKTQQFYYQGGALGTNATATDGTGLIFFFNVPPGQVHLEATPQAIGRVSSRVDVVVQPGVVAYVQGVPTPTSTP